MDAGERTTGTRDEHYELISVLYHALHGAENCEVYAVDAEAAGKADLAAFFREAQATQSRLAERAKILLGIVEGPPEGTAGPDVPPGTTAPGDVPPQSASIQSGAGPTEGDLLTGSTPSEVSPGEDVTPPGDVPAETPPRTEPSPSEPPPPRGEERPPEPPRPTPP